MLKNHIVRGPAQARGMPRAGLGNRGALAYFTFAAGALKCQHVTVGGAARESHCPDARRGRELRASSISRRPGQRLAVLRKLFT